MGIKKKKSIGSSSLQQKLLEAKKLKNSHQHKLITEPTNKQLPSIPLIKSSTQITKKVPDYYFQSKFHPVNKNTMLLNQMIEILKNGQSSNNKTEFYQNRPKRIATQESHQKFNQFIQKDIKRNLKSSKNAHPIIIQNQITKISNFGNLMRRNLKSEQKSRKRGYALQKKPSQNSLPKDKQSIELLTFYNNKNNFDSLWINKNNITLEKKQLPNKYHQETNQFI